MLEQPVLCANAVAVQAIAFVVLGAVPSVPAAEGSAMDAPLLVTAHPHHERAVDAEGRPKGNRRVEEAKLLT